jgi:hypothetical protein
MNKIATTLKSYVPSRGWAIFWFSVGGIGSSVIYDKQQTNYILADAKRQAAVIGSEPASKLLLTISLELSK